MKALLQALRLGGHKIKKLGAAVEADDAPQWQQAYQTKSFSLAPPLPNDTITLFITPSRTIEILRVSTSSISYTGGGVVNYNIYGLEAGDRTIITNVIVEDTDSIGSADGSLELNTMNEIIADSDRAIVLVVNTVSNIKEFHLTIEYRLL
jgi:hypothetical protein